MYGYIYKTTNIVNGKIYIGQKKSSEFLGNSYLGSGKILKKAVDKYGHNNFNVELIEIIDCKEFMNEREIYWILKYDSRNPEVGYNISFGGNGGDTFSSLSDECKFERNKRLSKTISGRVRVHKDDVEKSIDRCDIDLYLKDGWVIGGKPHSQDTLLKLQNTLKNMIWITDGEHNKRVNRDTALESYPGYYIGFTSHKKPQKSYAEIKAEKQAEFFKTEHYCEKCGKLITEFIGSGRFCSRSCATSHRHTEETKQKLSELNKLGVCGNKGRKWTDEQQLKRTESIREYHLTHKLAWVTYDNKISKRILIEELDEYLSNGWVRGQIKGVRVAWNKGLTAENDVRVKNNTDRSHATYHNNHKVKEGDVDNGESCSKISPQEL